MLEEATIRELAEQRIYERGMMYYRQNRVHELKGKGAEYTATVSGSDTYDVQVSLSSGGDGVFSYECTCPSARKYFNACKHVIAVLKEIQHRQELESFTKSASEAGNRVRASGSAYQSGANMLAYFKSMVQRKQPQRLQLEPQLFSVCYYGQYSVWLEFKLGEERLYVIKNIIDFLHNVKLGNSVEFGKNLTVDTSAMEIVGESSKKLWQMLQRVHNDLMNSYMRASYVNRYDGGRSLPFQQKRFYLTPSHLEEFLECMGDTEFLFQYDNEAARRVSVVHENPRLRLSVQDKAGNGILSLPDEDICPLDSEYRFIRCGNRIHVTDSRFRELVVPLMSSFAGTDQIQMSKSQMADFLGSVLPKLEYIADVDLPASLTERFFLEPLQPEFYLDYYHDGVEVRPSFHYGNTSFNPILQAGPVSSGQLTLVRDMETEIYLLSVFDTYGFFQNDGIFVQPDEEKAYDFLTEGLPLLAERADIFYADAFQKKPVQRMNRITAGVSVNDNNLLEMRLQSDDLDMDEIFAIIASYRKKRRYHRMKDGTFITLEEQQLSAVAELVDSLGVRKGAVNGENVEIPLSRAMYLDALAREEDGIRLERSARFRSIVRDIRHPTESELEVPASLEHTLREYQATGFRWLSTLAAYGLGGILADDMGLGKTIQVLAFLLSAQRERKVPALVVVPTSLLYNWADEVQRFTPELKVRMVNGSKADRRNQMEDSDGDTDIFLTTYNMLARDLELYEGKNFSYCFLDEAQHIKNPDTQKARAVKKIKASVCFALTGTPIENTLTELWSIFDFLMPGYLLSHAKFKQRFEVPIVRAQDTHAAKDLKRRVMPFILRRMKREVLKELPDKVERRVVNEMTEEQARVYKAYFVQAKKEFAEEMKNRGLGESRIKILALLTRLRQIACDPSLFLEDYDGGSGKLELLGEVIEDAVSSGHRMLIFSQFTTMLQHIATWLDDRDMDYLYLDGQTPSIERLRLVKRFNEGEMPIFLISLKAGGTGLNLTGADMVIHYDPWWNPAVEDQATDRAYRLGQKNNVQVLKLITKNTIEEQIYELQEKKKSLIDQMIEPGENFLSKLTDEEIRGLFA